MELQHLYVIRANLCFNLSENPFGNKLLNGLNLMVEYDSCTMKVGGSYSVWKDRINVVTALYDGQYWSVGMYFKVCLK